MTYEPGLLTVEMEGMSEAILTVTTTIESLVSLQQFGKAFIGFTASTGATLGANQNLISWSYQFCELPQVSFSFF